MYPSIQIGHLLIPTLSTVLWGTVIVLLLCSAIQCKRYKLDIGVVVGGVLVGVAGFALSGWRFYDSLWRHATSNEAAGGYLIAVAAVFFWARSRQVSFLRLADCLSPPLALCVVVVRLGCLMAGCDFGKPTSYPWGVTFTNGLALSWYGTPLGIPLHPTQLYESALAAGTLAVLIVLQRRPQPDGKLFSVFISCFAVGRFLIEFLRGDMGRGSFGPLSAPQWYCMIAVTMVVINYIYAQRFTKRPPGRV